MPLSHFTPHPNSPQKHLPLELEPALNVLTRQAKIWANLLANQGFIPQNKITSALLVCLNKASNIPPHIQNRSKEPLRSQAFFMPQFPHIIVIFNFKRGTAKLPKLPKSAWLLTHEISPHGRSRIAPHIPPADEIIKICAKNKPSTHGILKPILPKSLEVPLVHQAYKLQWKWRPDAQSPWPEHWSSTVAMPYKHGAEQALRLKQKFEGNGEYQYQIIDCIWEQEYAHMPWLHHPSKI